MTARVHVPAGGTGNKGFDADMAASKIATAEHTLRQVRDGVSFAVPGLGTMLWECSECATINEGDVWQAATNDVYCRVCRCVTEHARYRPLPVAESRR